MSDDAVSLYFGIKKGETADLEIVAEAALHWVASVRAAAYAIDPKATITVGFVDASEGSLKLNTIFEWAEKHLERIDQGSGQYPRLRKLAIALAVFAALDGSGLYDQWFADSPTLELSVQD